MSETPLQLLRRAAELRRDGREVGACLVIKARGSTPQQAGALMLVDDQSTCHGTIGGGCVEAEVRRRAFELLGSGASGVMTFKLDHDYGWDDGLICGGTLHLAVAPMPEAETLEAMIEAIGAREETELNLLVKGEAGVERYTVLLPPRDRLYIAGAGHIGQAVARLALPLDFDVTVIDDRPDLVERATPAGATGVCGDIATTLCGLPVDGATYCIVVTRGHKHDEQALAAVVEREARYVGMIGSRRKVKLIADDLLERGVRASALEQVHAPIGVDIDAVTVEEIAVSIVAQLIQVRRAGRRDVVQGPIPIPVGAQPPMPA